MAKKQTRRTVSMSAARYELLTDLADYHDRPRSAFVEYLICECEDGLDRLSPGWKNVVRENREKREQEYRENREKREQEYREHVEKACAEAFSC